MSTLEANPTNDGQTGDAPLLRSAIKDKEPSKKEKQAKKDSDRSSFDVRESIGLPLFNFFSGKRTILGKIVLAGLGIGYLLLLVFLYLSHTSLKPVNKEIQINDGDFKTLILDLSKTVKTVAEHEKLNKDEFVKTKTELNQRLDSLEKKVEVLIKSTGDHDNTLLELSDKIRKIRVENKFDPSESKAIIEFFTKEIREEVKKVVSKTLQENKLSNDTVSLVLSRLGRTNKINVAQKGAGALILDHSKAYDHTKQDIVSGIVKKFLKNPLLVESTIVLEGSDVELGECFPLKKEKTKEGTDKPSYITIKLAREEPISAVTISHIPAGLTPSITSAPRDFTATCISFTPDPTGKSKKKKEERVIVEGKFDAELLPHQTFEANKGVVDGKEDYLSCKAIRFDFLTNYGNEDFTCVYRLQVHSANNEKYAEDNVKILKGYQTEKNSE
ncbi:MAG: hypothetical protein EZS28_013260 [Streblomastix strix]|uniref:SUN domain-containing protein n=1 Tax=Streblomastix strix TaxID=222440 RepID=A0A5J4W8J3_9EUKA|nr:MAG: hypothetical protein EZS28_013260 [Streblomastix strix]